VYACALAPPNPAPEISTIALTPLAPEPSGTGILSVEFVMHLAVVVLVS
jgi:hypothetical protein